MTVCLTQTSLLQARYRMLILAVAETLVTSCLAGWVWPGALNPQVLLLYVLSGLPAPLLVFTKVLDHADTASENPMQPLAWAPCVDKMGAIACGADLGNDPLYSASTCSRDESVAVYTQTEYDSMLLELLEAIHFSPAPPGFTGTPSGAARSTMVRTMQMFTPAQAQPHVCMSTGRHSSTAHCLLRSQQCVPLLWHPP